MATPTSWRSSLGLFKRLKLSPNTNVLLPRIQKASLANVQDPKQSLQNAVITNPDGSEIKVPDGFQHLTPSQQAVIARAPLPRNLQLYYLRPLRRQPTHGLPVCDLQLRSYSLKNLEFFCDFAMRAAYYLNLPARGPVPLPRITQRWTVPRSNFVHKKSQENFERVTLRRLIQIQDGHPETVQVWLGYLAKRSYHGVGMKANLFEFEALGVGKRMDEMAGETDADLEEEWGNFGMRMNAATAEKVEELLGSEAFSKPRRDMEAYFREPIEVKKKKS